MKALQIKDFPEYYITNTGDVYSRQIYHNLNGRIKKLTPAITKTGYLRIWLSKNHKKTMKFVHRLVAEAFISNPNKKSQINHKNGIRTDNCAENLEWCSASENILHAYRVLHKAPNTPNLNKLGKESTRAKIVQQIKDGKIIAEFYGVREASRKTGIHIRSIYQCCQGISKSGYGYNWAYKK